MRRPSPHRGAFAVGLLLLMVSATALAQRPPTRPGRADMAAPRKTNVYGDDPMAPIKLRVEELLGLYQLEPPRRHVSERVAYKKGVLQITFWQPVPGLSVEELKTRAVKWFTFGRTQYAGGIRGVFSELDEVKQVVLVFHEVIREDEKRGRQKGRRRAGDTVKPYLILGMDRRRFERLDVNILKRCVESGDCSKAFRAFPISRFNTRYVKTRQDDE